MKLFDLTHSLDKEISVFPGDEQPSITTTATCAKNGYRASHLEISSHTGTHIDAPAHLVDGAPTLDTLPLDHFTGKAIIIPIEESEKEIELERFLEYIPFLTGVDFILFKTGWSQYWGTPKYLEDYPVLTEKATEWLTRLPLKGVGFDTISPDKIDSIELSIHKQLLSNNILIIENLNIPDEISNNNKLFFQCYPLLYPNADGSPIRAIIQQR